ncbi:hypothetical protein A0H76_2758 [Hepatospora eriocheir]|uniref:Uncharacterized protein n=1 Tax=Hepatospora eriocheir TaxID=1081669 RepID=A0A1X0QJE2_9MICR|nr:hypothetical protein A0H76_2758 [Hepatospora eriocheir]
MEFKTILNLKSQLNKIVYNDSKTKFIIYKKESNDGKLYRIESNSIERLYIMKQAISAIFIKEDLYIIKSKNIFLYNKELQLIDKQPNNNRIIYMFPINNDLNDFILIYKDYFEIKENKKEYERFYIQDSYLIIHLKYKIIVIEKYKNYFLTVKLDSIKFDLIIKKFNLTELKKITINETIKDKITFISIRNKKLYSLINNNRIIGYDLNLYLKNEIQSFLNIERSIILFDKKNLQIYQKNLDKCIFECKAKDFVYTGKHLLVTDNEGYFKVYEIISEYIKTFTLINESIFYKEEEDEFDNSDDSHEDF